MAGNIPGTSSARMPKGGQMPRGNNFPNSPKGNQVRDIKGAYAGGFAINWVGLEAIVDDLQNYQGMWGGQADDKLEQLATDIALYAQKSAPWEDQSGNARAGLETEVQRRPNGEVAIILFHQVDYGVYLENANGGAYAVIIPTLEHFAQELGTRLFGPSIKRGGR